MTLALPDAPASPAVPAPRPRLLALVDRLSAVLDGRTSRRGFLSRVAVVGSAVAVAPVSFALRPGTAYANVCGPSSSCSSGYTVFCATITGGVNRCPPNSLVGGWWKADGSGFCGGGARYYIDCHSYCSCGCGGTSRFCGEGCRSCSCGCGPGGQCDQRKVCCNNFRYGQCMTHVSCTGPVWCRVVTCTPPWRVPQWECSSRSLTDNNTLHHSSPRLPGWTPVVAHHASLGGPGGRLGEPRTGEGATHDGAGRFTDYDGGGIVWHPDHGVHAVFAGVRDKYYALGGTRGKLGFPTSGETPLPDGIGTVNSFTGGDAYRHPSYGVNVVFFSIRDVFNSLGRERGRLGYPTSDELRTADGAGVYNRFEHGDVFWHPTHGTQPVLDRVRDVFTVLGREAGRLGYPVSGEIRCADGVGRYTRFQRGEVYVHKVHGARAVLDRIRDVHLALGRESGRLGYPVSDEVRCTDGVGRYSRFVRGDVYSHKLHGTHAVLDAVRDKHVALGRESGPLRYPVSGEQTAPRSGRFTDFSGDDAGRGPRASIYWSPATGAWSVSGAIREEWLRRGGAGGALGFPVSDPYSTAGKVRSDFENGSLVHDPATGETTLVAR